MIIFLEFRTSYGLGGFETVRLTQYLRNRKKSRLESHTPSPHMFMVVFWYFKGFLFGQVVYKRVFSFTPLFHFPFFKVRRLIIFFPYRCTSSLAFLSYFFRHLLSYVPLESCSVNPFRSRIMRNGIVSMKCGASPGAEADWIFGYKGMPTEYQDLLINSAVKRKLWC